MVRISSTSSNVPLRPGRPTEPPAASTPPPVKSTPSPLAQAAPTRQRVPSVAEGPSQATTVVVGEVAPEEPDTQFAGLVSEVQALNHRLGIYRELPEDVVAQAYYWGESLFVDTKV